MPPQDDIALFIANLFDRPLEPLVKSRGGDIEYDIPNELLIERDRKFKSHQEVLSTSILRSDDLPTKTYKVQKLQEIPESIIQEIQKLGRDDNFCVFNREHLRLASELIAILSKAPDADAFLAICVYAHARVNLNLFVYAVSVAALHRDDIKDVPFASHVQIFPQTYFNSKIFNAATEKLAMNVDDPKKFVPVTVPHSFSGNDLDVEHRIAYWREDIFINLHHFHWHLVYPYSSPKNPEIVKKDRRGELFFYMHQQIQARYNFERLSNHLARVRSLNNYREPIPEGYYPKLNNQATGHDYPSRQANSVMRDLKRENEKNLPNIELNNMERWRNRILNDITDKILVQDNGNKIDLNSDEGIDYLGNLIEASDLSINPGRYGDLHNSGHLMLGYIHDPDNRHREESSVVANNAATMRDPIFYVWHAHIDDIFQEHKEFLNPYSEEKLNFEGISVENIEVEVAGGQKNEFYTHWQEFDVNIEPGMNYQPRGAIYARITHLQHKPFTYNIQVTNNGDQRTGTVRIFMAPTKSESREEFLFKQQRRLFIEMDKFKYDLKSGTNEIKRSSTESSVTIPNEQALQQGGDEYCKCGWPHHLLIPKGTTEGLEAKLFVMITNAADDKVEDVTGESQCKPAPSYCGLRRQKYPDKRAMGFPFDRRARDGVSKLDEFLTPNMKVTDVIIKHTGETVTPDDPKNDDA